MTNSWINYYNAADYAPTVGTGTATTINSPLTSSANISLMKTTACTLNIQTLANSNVNGAVYVAYSDSCS